MKPRRRAAAAPSPGESRGLPRGEEDSTVPSLPGGGKRKKKNLG